MKPTRFVKEELRWISLEMTKLDPKSQRPGLALIGWAEKSRIPAGEAARRSKVVNLEIISTPIPPYSSSSTPKKIEN